MSPRTRLFCPQCGALLDRAGAVPECATDGPQWVLARNGPAACVAILRDGRVLLTRRARAPWEGHWELPGGFQDLGEHPADTAVREAREEVGLEVTVTGLIGVYLHDASDPNDDVTDVRQVVTYVGTAVGEPRADPAEVSDWCWADPTDPPRPMVPQERVALGDLAAATPYHRAR